MEIRHFIVENDAIREFSSEEGTAVANGETLLPEYADSDVRYVQVMMDKTKDETGIQVHIAGAYLKFDESGRLSEANGRDDDDLDRFEQEACVHLALQNSLKQSYQPTVTIH